MTNKQTKSDEQPDAENKEFYDRIRAEEREKQKAMPSTDAATVLAALSGQPITTNQKEQI